MIEQKSKNNLSWSKERAKFNKTIRSLTIELEEKAIRLDDLELENEKLKELNKEYLQIINGKD